MKDDNNAPEFVTRRFPLSLLLLYSDRAKRELPKLGQGKQSLTWVLSLPASGYEAPGTSRAAAVQVLKWIKLKLPAKGFSPRYKTHVQFSRADIEDFNFATMLRVLVVLEALELPGILNHQRTVSQIMLESLEDSLPSISTLACLMPLAESKYSRLIQKTIEMAEAYYAPTDTELEITRRDYADFDEAYTAAETKRMKHLAWLRRQEEKERRQAEHKAYLERKEKREQKQQLADARVQRAIELDDQAKDGGRCLNDREVERKMGRL